MEREAKFRVDDPALFDQLAGLTTLAGYDLTPVETQQQHNSYYDTPDMQLQQRCYALRLRDIAERKLLTLKGESVVADGIHQREELEAETGSDGFAQGWPQGPLGEKLGALLGGEGYQNLKALFSIDTTRRRLLVGSQAAPLIELAMDYSTINAGELQRSFYELEAELLEHGSEQDLQAVVQALREGWALQPEAETKYERGLALLQSNSSAAQLASSQPIEQPAAEGGATASAWPTPEEASTAKARPSTRISADDSLAEAARKMLAQQLRKLRKHEAEARTGSDIEAVHQMRVATRRMRATLAVTHGAFKVKATASFGGMLRKLARTLGQVRDHDVFLADIEAYRAAHADAAPDLAALVARLEEERTAARAILVELFDSKKLAQAQRALKRFVQTPGLGVAAIKAKKHTVNANLVRYHLGSAVWGRYEELRAYETILADAPPETRHEMRIAGKWLRYVLELFEDVLDGSRYKEVRGRLMELQEHLGQLQDAEVSLAYLRSFADEQPSEGLSNYIAERERRRDTLLADFPRVWSRVNGLTFRRRLADVITQL